MVLLEFWKKAVRPLTPGGRQRSIPLQRSSLTTPFFSASNVSLQDYPPCRMSLPENSQVEGLWGNLIDFWLLIIEAVWLYRPLQLECILVCYLTGAFPETSRWGNWVSKNWSILPKFTQWVISSLLLFLSCLLPFLLFFLLERHSLKNVNSGARYMVLNPWLCMTLGKLLILVCLGPHQ